MTTRRALLALPALLTTARPGSATESPRRHDPPPLRTPRPVRLRPGAPPVQLHSAVDGLERRLDISFSGTDAPDTTFRFTSWYGYGRVFGVLPLRGRDVVLVAFEGNTGTGVYQELQTVIGQDDDGVARILALETLRARETAICQEASYLTIRITPLANGSGLRLDQFARGVFGTCGPPGRRPRPFRAEWGTTLRWDGKGAMTMPPPDPRAGPERRLVEAARARTAAWLAEAPRSAVSVDDLDRLELMAVLRTS